MNNRRNYYRILNVQPDASVEVIKANYRAIMQKMKLHPDLGGDQSSASLLNIAYDVLRNPTKREKYDQSLLEQYHIKQLSQGHLNINPGTNTPEDTADDSNQRNYYRVLHVQPDSPEAIILASYRSLIKHTRDEKNLALIEEAKNILTDDKQKQQYEGYLQRFGHAKAAKLVKQDALKVKAAQQNKATGPNNRLHTLYKTQQASQSGNQSVLHKQVQHHYQPVITQYCFFCMTPHNQSPSIDNAPNCFECNSPLFPPSDQFTNQSRRSINRASQTSNITVYYDWPSPANRQAMLDLSPTGMKTQTSDKLDIGQIIKIQADSFNAVGEISYMQAATGAFQYGIRFLTVQFEKQKGQFFSVKT